MAALLPLSATGAWSSQRSKSGASSVRSAVLAQSSAARRTTDSG
ncbi:hypothetical protein ACFWY6_44580 [Streptomyces sp. NPDC059037]